MKTIELTQGQIALVDDWNYVYLMQWAWYAWWSPITESYYAQRTIRNPSQKKIQMHRVIAKTPNNLICDHINHDTLCNLEENLRSVTRSQNGMNRRGASSNNKLGERCISPNRNSFQVHVIVLGKVVYNKNFKTLEEAKIARDEAVYKYYGEFYRSE